MHCEAATYTFLHAPSKYYAATPPSSFHPCHHNPPYLTTPPIVPFHQHFSFSFHTTISSTMSTICADQQHKILQHTVPPRKLFHSNSKKHQELNNMLLFPEEINSLHKFLPFNNSDTDSDPDSDPYSSDHFRMYEFKIRRCTRSRSHDWTDCPFAHPGEKARRRDPRRFHYSGAVCSEYRRGGGCSRGDDCEFAHGVFECWLHPSRYRTEACKDGKNCKRKVCFFAHTPRQLRILPEISTCSSPSSTSSPTKFGNRHQNCCLYCHNSMNASPTSTLFNMSHLSRSPSMSPPCSPVKNTFSPISRFSDRMAYKEVLNELMSSLDSLNFNEVSVSVPSPMSSIPSMSMCGGSGSGNVPWNIDVNCLSNVDQDQTQFVLSPSTPNPSVINSFSRSMSGGDCSSKLSLLGEQKSMITNSNNGESGCSDPDFGWVNELLM